MAQNVVDHAAELRKGADSLAPNNKLIADKMRAAADFIDRLSTIAAAAVGSANLAAALEDVE